ncbi:hypothetical protein SAMD00019534_021300 [Acytostelium subglobosum LB1]|uniref:hypothetical protein n=1 Tax=Acytostelium subglobosum LB1 TaxID=1410327 RepID=UPI000644DF70|nr:hypothetical protein SAMD00019534_021300 [Acytostelium subglobosum LB1]GAM18955.1 hypothetical protein SAMD00019534_021300 [Acytostelium subglobosum LB1]|eukprot:XP_012758175.1 hypothetical protein SAMD00019534_021300 [Acytostelium subglobosum LB1]
MSTTTKPATTVAAPKTAAAPKRDGQQSSAAGGAPRKDNRRSNGANTTSTTTTSTTGKDQTGEKKVYPVDPIMEAHRKKIDDAIEMQNKLVDKRAQLTEKMRANRAIIESLTKDTEGRTDDTKSQKDRKDLLKKKAEEERAELSNLIEQQRSRRDTTDALVKDLPIRINKKDENMTLEQAMIMMEKTAQDIEKEIEAETNVNAQKSLIKKQTQLSSQKKQLIEFFTQRESLSNFDTLIVAQKSKIAETKKELDQVIAKLNENHNLKTNSPSAEQRTKLREENNTLKKEHDEVHDKIQAISAQIKADKKAKDDYHKEREVQRAEEKKKRDEEWIAEKKRRDEEWAAEKKRREEAQKEREEKRRLEELSQDPYENDVADCEALVAYLNAIKPKPVVEKVATAQAVIDIEGYAPLAKKEDKRASRLEKKKVVAPKPLPEIIKHPLKVITDFERLSLALPNKYVDIDQSIVQINAKKEHYKQLSKQVMESRLKAQQDAIAAAANAATSSTSSTSEETTTTSTSSTATTSEQSETTTTAAVEEVQG